MCRDLLPVWTARPGLRQTAQHILIWQDRPNVESFLRQTDGAWSILNYTHLHAVAKVRSLGIEIPMTEIHAGVEWPAPIVAENAGS